jgi:two-component system response regulator YesN
MYKVYIIDDAILVRKELVLTVPWESLNCNVVGQSGNPQVALQEIIDLEPHIVITDIKMSHMSGLDLIQALKEKGCEAEFIVISAFSEFEYALSAIKLDVQDYLLKPISDAELLNALKKTMQRIEDKKESSIIKQRIQDTYQLKKAKINLLEDSVNSKLNIYLRKAIEYILLHFNEELTVRDIANQFLISESYLTKLFKQELNITFIEYLTQVRVRKSIEFMKDPGLPIYRITEMVGYKDYRYFSAVFKKQIGVSPSEYQKKII